MQSDILNSMEIMGMGSARIADAVYLANKDINLLSQFLDLHSSYQQKSKLKIMEIFLTQHLKFENALFIGHWHGLLPYWLFSFGLIKKAVGVELDAQWSAISKSVNNGFSWTSIVGDATQYSLWQNSELANNDFEIVVNTSCEHMNYNWLDGLTQNQLTLAQSTDYQIPEHINIVETMDEFLDKLKLSQVLFVSTQDFPIYKRFTVLGKK